MRCDIVIATWNAVPMTRTALESIRREAGFPYRLILVDNSDDEEARAWFREIAASQEFGDTLLIQNGSNIGWLKATNIGLRHADAEYICLLNNDVVCGSDWLSRIVALMEREPDIGLVNPRGNERSENARVEDINAYARRLARENAGLYTELDHCSGFCMVVRGKLFRQLGLLDEIFDGGYWEDNDFSRRAQAAGYRCAQCDDAFVLHLGSQSFSKLPEGPKRRMHDRNRDLCQQRWGKVRRLFVRICDPSPDAEALIALVRSSRVYLLHNRNVPQRVLDFRHEHLILVPRRGPWESLYFLLKAGYLAAKKRIDEVRVIYR